jgi:hypothetical protein
LYVPNHSLSKSPLLLVFPFERMHPDKIVTSVCLCYTHIYIYITILEVAVPLIHGFLSWLYHHSTGRGYIMLYPIRRLWHTEEKPKNCTVGPLGPGPSPSNVSSHISMFQRYIHIYPMTYEHIL